VSYAAVRIIHSTDTGGLSPGRIQRTTATGASPSKQNKQKGSGNCVGLSPRGHSGGGGCRGGGGGKRYSGGGRTNGGNWNWCGGGGGGTTQTGELEQHDHSPEAKLAHEEEGKVAMNYWLLTQVLIALNATPD
jgi:hypothetical protein